MPLPEGAGVYSTAAGDSRDRVIYSQQKIIESLTSQLEKLVEQLVRLTTPQPMPVEFSQGPLHYAEHEEDALALKTFEGEDTALDLNDPEVREILEAAGALSTEIQIAD